MLGGIFVIDAGDFTCLAGKREKWCPGWRLPLNAGELEALQKLKEKKAIFKLNLFNYQAFVNILLKIHFSFPISH